MPGRVVRVWGWSEPSTRSRSVSRASRLRRRRGWPRTPRAANSDELPQPAAALKSQDQWRVIGCHSGAAECASGAADLATRLDLVKRVLVAIICRRPPQTTHSRITADGERMAPDRRIAWSGAYCGW